MPDEDSLSVNSLFVEPPKQHKSFSLVSFTAVFDEFFSEPFIHEYVWFFAEQRKRKKDNDDSLSTHSTVSSSGELEDDGPSKRKKRLGKVASLANLFAGSPGSGGGMMHNARQALKKSISGMLHPMNSKEAVVPATPQQHQESGDKSPTLSSAGSVPSSPALLRTRGSIVSLSRLSVSNFCLNYRNSTYEMCFSQTSSNMTPYRPPAHTPTKHRVIRLWSETWGKTTALSLTNQEIKRQEVTGEGQIRSG